MSDGRVRLLTVVLLVTVVASALSRLELTHSITHFIPSADSSELVELSLELVDSPLAGRMVLSIGGGPERANVAAELAEALRPHPEVLWVVSGFDEDALQSIYTLYYDRRVYFGFEEPAAELPRLLEPTSLELLAEQLRGRLAQPGSVLVARSAPADPLGLFDRIVARIRATQPGTARGGGGFESVSGEHAIVLLGLRSSPFATERQERLLNDIEAEFTRIRSAYGAELVLEQSGVNRRAVASERSVKGDVDLISVVSVTVVCLLFLLVFGSLRQLLIAIITPLGGFSAALAVSTSSSTPIHGITLAFGFILLGVAIDYPIHLMNHHALSATGTQPRESLARIRASLLLSGLTTTLAFAALSLSDFPGLGDMGAFAAIGVPVALALTLFSVPAFLAPSQRPSPVQRMLSAALLRYVAWLDANRGFAAALFLLPVAVAAAGLPQLNWEDDPASLMAIDPQLRAEEERVRAHISDIDGGRFVVALAPDSESALILNDQIFVVWSGRWRLATSRVCARCTLFCGRDLFKRRTTRLCAHFQIWARGSTRASRGRASDRAHSTLSRMLSRHPPLRPYGRRNSPPLPSAESSIRSSS